MPKLEIKQRPLLTRPESFQDVPSFIAEILARRGVESQQELELRVTESGYAMTGAKIRTPAHQHSISGFFKKLLGQ